MDKPHILYLGDPIQQTPIYYCLERSDKFGRITHLTKPTLSFTHVDVKPNPEVILLKCDWEGGELSWTNRYDASIPKIFVICGHCLYKGDDYLKHGHMYNFESAMANGDMFLNSLVELVESLI